ncbi:MAG: NAD(P)H-dependent oxidoreductase subunit E [Myxococcota bacterium]|jgi:NADH-quinone oxidoreductase subunit E
MKSVETILKEHPNAGRDSLIPILQEVQEALGYLSQEAIAQIGRELRLPSSKIFGVATFYNQFRFEPKGKFHVQICRGTACHVKGSKKMLDLLQKEMKIEPGKCSRDKVFSLEVVACMGACALSPVMCINGQYYSKVNQAKVLKLLDGCRQQAVNEARA